MEEGKASRSQLLVGKYNLVEGCTIALASPRHVVGAGVKFTFIQMRSKVICSHTQADKDSCQCQNRQDNHQSHQLVVLVVSQTCCFQLLQRIAHQECKSALSCQAS